MKTSASTATASTATITMKRLSLMFSLALVPTACGDDISGGDTEGPNSGFVEDDDSTPTSAGPGTSPTTPTTPGSATENDADSDPSGDETSPDNPGTDDGEPSGPGFEDELCDAGDEAYVKRLIPFTQGRKPSSIREVRLLADLIAQLDRAGVDGRRVVALGLLRGDAYLERWKEYMYEELRINLSDDRRNEECYDQSSAAGDTAALAAFIRDNVGESDFGTPFFMPDVARSALLLDDISPLLRADTYARYSAPFIAANVGLEELEEMQMMHFGSLFEASMMGRTTDCLQCHTAEDAVTDSVDPEADRHHPVPGNLELGAYGPDAKESSLMRSYGIFRLLNFATPQDEILGAPGGVPAGSQTAFGFDPACGAFDFTPGNYFGNTFADWDSFLMGDHQPGDTIVQLDAAMRSGFDTLRSNGGVTIAADQSVAPDEAGAYLMSMHIANRMWTQALGFPLQVANGFPRNDAQKQILQTLTDDFISNSFSLRNLIADVATHPYFNQAPPDTCGATTPYHMPAVFDPFTKEAADPGARGNGVGDTVHRYGARVLLGSIAQSMWWNRPDAFGPGTGQIPAFNCGETMPQVPCVDAPEDAQVLRDLGAFLSDGDSGFSGTDLVVMLRMENDFGGGEDPGMNGRCTGPLGGACAADDWITQLIDVAMDTPGTDMWDVASAVKDRMITAPTIVNQAEVAVIEDLIGESLSEPVSDVGAANAEAAARLLAGMLTNTPQFMLAGVPSRDQDEASDPVLVVDGTDTLSLCEYLAPFILTTPDYPDLPSYTCSDDGIALD